MNSPLYEEKEMHRTHRKQCSAVQEKIIRYAMHEEVATTQPKYETLRNGLEALSLNRRRYRPETLSANPIDQSQTPNRPCSADCTAPHAEKGPVNKAQSALGPNLYPI